MIPLPSVILLLLIVPFFPSLAFITLPSNANIKTYSLRSIAPINDEQPIVKYNHFEQLFFDLFAKSVAIEMNDINNTPTTFKDLIKLINKMVISSPLSKVHDQGKNALVRLFPPFILPLYRLSFTKFPQFSAWMNTWVTHMTTSWLMGPSKVVDLVLENGGISEIRKEQELVIEKCIFLEESKCLKTCIHACKIPTQRFFAEEMSLPVTLKPNVTDYSCRFQFGVKPLPLEEDEISSVPYIAICPTKLGADARRQQLSVNAITTSHSYSGVDVFSS